MNVPVWNTVPLPSRSVHPRLSVCADHGLNVLTSVNGSCATNFPTLPLRAVLPFPNRSYATPTRGIQSLHLGTSLMALNWRAGTQVPAAADCAGIDSFR